MDYLFTSWPGDGYHSWLPCLKPISAWVCLGDLLMGNYDQQNFQEL